MVLLDKDSKRITSIYTYLNRLVKFSKEATFKPIKLPPIPRALAIPPRGVATKTSDLRAILNQLGLEKGKK